MDRRRLLCLLPFPPRLDAAHGGSRAMAGLLSILALRHDLALLSLRADDEPPTDPLLIERGAMVEEVRRPTEEKSGLDDVLNRLHFIFEGLRGKPEWAVSWSVAAYAECVRGFALSWQPDIVHVHYHVMGQYLPALSACSSPRVLTEYEPGVQAARERRQRERGWAQLRASLDASAWRRFEASVMQQVDAGVVLTERDRRVLSELSDPTTLIQIPLGTDLQSVRLSPLGKMPPRLLFIGNFIHPPNVDAAVRLIDDILPNVRARHPDTTVYIVGKDPPPELRQRAGDHVFVTGYVPSVTPYLEDAAVVVVPLRRGGGMRTKVLEALAAGKAVVASPLAVEGLDVGDGEHVLVAESDEAMINAITMLLERPERCAELATHAHAWAHAHLGWEQSASRYEELYEELLAASLESCRKAVTA